MSRESVLPSPSESGVPYEYAFRQKLERMLTELYGLVSPAGTKVYRALLTQTGTDAPVATVLENTLGASVVWTRDDVGAYRATLAGAFPAAKTIARAYATDAQEGTGLVL
jgi:hypothetical protein